jgi:Spy/CpxP family protein refolding chaperone
MLTMKYFLMAGMALGLAAGLGVFGAVDDAKPKSDIEEIMDKAHGGKANSLYNKVKTGKASAEQQKQLVELYQELAKNKPPKGDLKDWQRRTNAMVKAAKDVVDGKEGATQALAKAVQCGACHKLHKED